MLNKNSDKKMAEVIGAALLFGMTSVVADTLTMPDAKDAYSVVTPNPGSYMMDVVDMLGEPDAKSDAVGVPPISRWDYNDFRVYFENDRVIHSVKR